MIEKHGTARVRHQSVPRIHRFRPGERQPADRPVRRRFLLAFIVADSDRAHPRRWRRR
ncbi:hypothetical protein M8494_20400 [Serratia ureilytica]